MVLATHPPTNATTSPPSSADELFEQFDIEFDAGQEPVFHGGELVSGQLKIKLKTDAILNAIHLQFKGRASWTGTGKKSDKDGQTDKVYFDKNFVLLERPPGHPEPGHFKWNAGFPYSLPFECPLPIGCETSFENPHAYIRYYARAILETEKQERFVTKKAFSIVSPPDLHQLVSPYSEPVSRKETIRFGGCCCRSKISAEIHLPKSSFAPGENIVGAFSIDSRTAKSAIGHIEVRLLDNVERINRDHSAPKISDGEVAKEEEADVQNAKKKKGAKSKSKAKSPQPTPTVATWQRVLASKKIEGAKLLADGEEPLSKSPMVTRNNVVFITVPAVIPTIQKEAEFVIASRSADEELEESEQPFSRLLESPSTATIRARKEPFIGVKYSLQIALGPHILMELPVVVHPIPIYAKEIGFRPFAGGAQLIGEPDEANFQPYGGPFCFTPLYPVYIEGLHQFQEPEHVSVKTAKALDAQPIATPNGINGKVVPETRTTTTVVETKVIAPNEARVHNEEMAEYVFSQQPPIRIEPEICVAENGPNNSIHENGKMQQTSTNGQTNRRLVEETYVVENEDGTQTTIHKTTEQFTATSVELSSFEHPFIINNGAAEDSGVVSMNSEHDKQHQQSNNNNQQMDVSMSG